MLLVLHLPFYTAHFLCYLETTMFFTHLHCATLAFMKLLLYSQLLIQLLSSSLKDGVLDLLLWSVAKVEGYYANEGRITLNRQLIVVNPDISTLIWYNCICILVPRGLVKLVLPLLYVGTVPLIWLFFLPFPQSFPISTIFLFWDEGENAKGTRTMYSS